MSNRQARRQQSRQSRQQRQSRASGGGGGRAPSGGGGGGGLFSTVMSPFVLGAAALAIALGGIVVFLAVTSDGGAETSEAVQSLEEAHENLPRDKADGYLLGVDDAPVKLIVFEDFQCPHCLRWAAMFEPTIVDEYVTTDMVQIEFRNLPVLGSESFDAAAATYCTAEQNLFWDLHNEIYLIQARAGQLERGQSDAGRLTAPALRSVVEDLGADMDAYDACINSPEPLAVVAEQEQQARSYGFSGTPSFVINGAPQMGGASTVDGWREILDAAYAEATGSEPDDGDDTAE